MKYYLAGPMTGLPNYNFAAFDFAAAHLRSEGLEIASPHEIDHGETEDNRGQLSYGIYMKAALKMLIECDAIIMLPGWGMSRGASLELKVATGCDMPVYTFHPAALKLTLLIGPTRNDG